MNPERSRKITKLNKTASTNRARESDSDSDGSKNDSDISDNPLFYDYPTIKKIFMKTISNFKTNTFNQDSVFREKERKTVKEFISDNFRNNEKEPNFSTLIIFG